MVLAVALAGLAGALYSPISGRLRGIYLGIASIGLVFIGQHILFNATGLTGGFNGRDAEPFSLFGFSFADDRPGPHDRRRAVRGDSSGSGTSGSCSSRSRYYYARHLVDGRPGRALETVRDSEVAAAVNGVDVTRYKAAAFTVSSMYAGLSGVLLALVFSRIVPESFGLALSVEFLAMIVIGGLGSIRGAVLGGIFVSMLPKVLDHYSDSLPFLAARRLRRRRRARAGRALRVRRGDRRRPRLRARRDRRASGAAPASPRPTRCPLRRREPHECSHVPPAGGRLTLLLAIAGGACGKAEDESGGGPAASGEVKTGPGVTARHHHARPAHRPQRRLRAAGDGVHAGPGDVLEGAERRRAASAAARSSSINKDAAYDVQKAVSLYHDTEPDVAAISQVVGSPIIAALLPTFEKDSMLAVAAAWPPAFLDAESVAIIGATYDIEAINGIEWLMENKGLKEGDAIGDLYFEGDFGEGGLIGVKYAAEKYGLKVVEQKIKATDEDMSGAAAKFKREGVKAIWVTTAPGQLASLAGVAKSIGLDVPIGTNGPVFGPQLLDTPVGDTLDKNVTVFNSSAAYASDSPEVKKVAAAYEKAYPKGVPQQAVVIG